MYICTYRYMTDISNLKRFEQIELQAKLLNYFLGSNKSNINQYTYIYIYIYIIHADMNVYISKSQIVRHCIA